MYDAIIIGGGPAGLTSAIYLRRANKKVLVLEANVCGGQIVTAQDVENYPGYTHISGFDLSENMTKLSGTIRMGASSVPGSFIVPKMISRATMPLPPT